MVKIPSFLKTVKKWSKANVAIPLFFHKEYIKSSLDSFPIEFLNIKYNSKPVFGEDITNIIEINNEDLRLQIEREIKGKLLKLRQVYFEFDLKPKMFHQFVSVSLPTFDSIFSAAVYLKKGIFPKSRKDIYQNVSDIFAIDEEFFDKLIKIKKEELKVEKEDITPLWEKYVDNIKRVSLQIDKHIL